MRLSRNVTTASAESAVWPAMRAATAHANAWKDEAQRIAQRNGYVTRVKHFFSNKNEVTIMARLLQLDGPAGQGE